MLSQSCVPRVTTNNISSYGYLFHDILLGAADSARIGQTPRTYQTEDLSDNTYNLRTPGLNTDLPSLTTLSLVSPNLTALLSPSTLSTLSSASFSLFFQHFLSSPIPPAPTLYNTGTWGLQPLSTPLLISATLSTPTTQLTLNPAAVLTTLILLAILLSLLLLLTAFSPRALKLLPRDVDTLGSVLGFLYSSERLLHLAANRPANPSQNEEKIFDGEDTISMGWFNSNGKRRWGIEVVDRRETAEVAPLVQHVSLEGEPRATSFDTYEAIAAMALSVPSRPSRPRSSSSSRFVG